MKYRMIYKGKLRQLKVTNIEINEGVSKLIYSKPVIKEDILFYEGLFGTMISFEHGTKLPDEGEAYDIVKTSIMSREEPNTIPYPTCNFVNYDEIVKSKMVSKKELKEMIKTYKRK